MREYTVICERGDDGGWGAYVPGLPGLGAFGDTLEEANHLVVDGIAILIAGLTEDGLPVPAPASVPELVSVPAA